MTTKNVTRLFAALALCLGVTSMIGTAHAEWIMIDCHGTNGNPGWANTDNDILIAATRTDGTSEIRWLGPPGTGKCDADNSFPLFIGLHGNDPHTGQPVLPIRSIEIYMSGSDRFFVDQIRVLNDAMSSEFAHFGANNTSGWCFSTDPNDGFNANCSGAAEDYRSFVFEHPIPLQH